MRTAGFVLTLFAAQIGFAAPPADPDDALVRRLIEALKDPDQEVRQNVAVALAKTGVACIDPLTDALKDTNPERRAGAAYALGLMGAPARSALPALLDALNDKEADVRRQASYAIGRVMPVRDPVMRPVPRVSDPPAPLPLRGGVQ